MVFQQKLALKQGQGLVMTPQLSQSIKLLALSNIELTAFVEQELEKNPFLEKAGSTEENRAQQADAGIREETSDGAVDVAELTTKTELETSAKALSENIGSSLENVYPDEQDYRTTVAEKALSRESQADVTNSSGVQLSSSASSHDQEVADYTAQQETLRDHLTGQLAISAAPVELHGIVADMIENIDDAGYLSAPLDDFEERLGADTASVLKALDLLQSFDPVGIGARDLAECLSLQLKERDHLDPAMLVVVNNLDLLAKRDFAALKKLCHLEVDELHDALKEIQELDPKPGTAFQSNPIQHVVPDVLLRNMPDGSWGIELNNETLPRVLINNTYATQLDAKLQSGEDREFMTQCLQNASWLTKSLDQRAQTILKVAREIVKQQDAFFVHGVQHLLPLTLRMVADEIDMHESSVSRVTSNKYILTPRGLFELKYFFTTSIVGTDGDATHSSESVRHRIRELIDAETSKSILSDDAIVEALKITGVDIARRTIAKYRDAMNIPSSVQRRREKRAQEMSQRVDA